MDLVHQTVIILSRRMNDKIASERSRSIAGKGGPSGAQSTAAAGKKVSGLSVISLTKPSALEGSAKWNPTTELSFVTEFSADILQSMSAFIHSLVVANCHMDATTLVW
jgi:hypothetical protein